jgi:hypothetical protein
MRTIRLFAVTLSLVAATLGSPLMAPAQGDPAKADPVIEGVNECKFGIVPAVIEKAHPDAYLHPVPTPKAGERVPPFTLPLYTIPGQTVGPLKDCALDCQFFNNKLYQVYVACPQPRSEILAYLMKEYGKPGIQEGPVKQWLFTSRAVSYTEASGQFLVEDLPTSQKIHMMMLSFLSGGGGSIAPDPKAKKPEAK